ncbi:MAG: hypothetical protein AB2L20_31050 [Mangrovibacterium sp.]
MACNSNNYHLLALLQELIDIAITQPIGCASTGEGGVSLNSRVRSLDAIPFNKSFRFDMESWQTFGGPVKYAVACFWYGKFQ